MNPNELVDIRTVSVDKDLPQDERIAEYIRQIGNPRRFMCGDFIINAIYPKTAQPMNDCLRSTVP